MDLASITEWTPTTTPTSTTLSTIAATYVPALQSKLSNAIDTLTSKGSTIDIVDYISVSRIIRGAQASLSIISAQQVLLLPLTLTPPPPPPLMYNYKRKYKRKRKQYKSFGKQQKIF